MTTNFFQRSFALCLVDSIFKVSNDSDKYLPRHSIIKDCLESDVHHRTLQILLILIDFIQGRAFFVRFFRYFLKSLNLVITLGLETTLRNGKR